MKINNVTIEFKAINNVPVFTFKDTDKIFRWSSGTANRLFNKIKNFKNYLTESKDYYYISKAELIEQNPELKEFVGQKQYIRLYVVTTSTIGLMIELLNDKEYSRALSNFKKIVTNSNFCICELGKGDNNYQHNYYNRSNNPQATAPETIEKETRGCTPINTELSIYAYNFDGEFVATENKNCAYVFVGYATGNNYLLININHKDFTYYKNLFIEYLQADTVGKNKIKAIISNEDLETLNMVAEYLEYKFKDKFNNLLTEFTATISDTETPAFKEYINRHLIA